LSRDEISNAILHYLLEHPDAGDSIEGITNWWVLHEGVETEVDKVVEVVDELVSKGLLREVKNSTETKFYFVNKSKLPEISKLFNNEKGRE
jgi:hypothetical protein